MSGGATPELSILVCAFNMGRELPRTLYSLSEAYQRDAQGIDWEVVVLDNGSDPPVRAEEVRSFLPKARIDRPDMVRRSPVAAINAAMRDLRGEMVGLCIDGARIASPGIVRHAVEVLRDDRSGAVGTLAFHLGPDAQTRTVQQGYDSAREDALLESANWREDGYRLFDISALAGSSAPGWFGCINETNALFMHRAMWDAVGGLDERFASPGGGYANLDLWERVVEASGRRPWMILGEGTFHQVHGGVATNGRKEARAEMRAEYEAIHGRAHAPPEYRPRYVGSLDHARFATGGGSPLDRRRKVHSVRQRHFRVDVPTETLSGIQNGTLRTRYKGLRLAKNPFDLVLYMQTLANLRPATIIEVGASEGGSAAWLIDQCRALGLMETRMISIDRKPPKLELAGVSFHGGDSLAPEDTFPSEAIASAPHPWLVIEDSAHSFEATRAVIDYFDRRLQPGDLLVVEDGVVADLEGKVYRRLNDGPNRAVADLLTRAGARYEIDAALCDFFGHNVTYAPNAWLRRTQAP